MVESARQWVRVKVLTKQEKATIGERCDAFIAQQLIPRFLPEVTPTQWNFPVLLHGKWRGSKYSFFIRYRSGWDENAGEEFDAAWLRLDHDEECVAQTRFSIMWHRHTGQWFQYHGPVSLDEALKIIENDPFLQPHL